jgi:hypothetical protein
MIERIRQKLELPHTPLAIMHLKMQPASSRILLCFIGGTIVWVLYFMFVYALTSLTCYWGWFATPDGAFGTGLKGTQIIATVIAAGFIPYFGWLTYREWRIAGAGGYDVADETTAARDPMLAFVTLLVNALYLLIVAVSLVPVLMLPACMR